MNGIDACAAYVLNGVQQAFFYGVLGDGPNILAGTVVPLAILRIFYVNALDATELVALGILKCFFGRRRWLNQT